MMDRIFEMIEIFLVNLGMALDRLSLDDKKMISYFLASLLVAAVTAQALRHAVLH